MNKDDKKSPAIFFRTLSQWLRQSSRPGRTSVNSPGVVKFYQEGNEKAMIGKIFGLYGKSTELRQKKK
jgi:hypothetical protein